MKNKNMLEVIKYQIVNDKICDTKKYMKEMYLCFFYQNLNRWANVIKLDEYWDLQDCVNDATDEEVKEK